MPRGNPDISIVVVIVVVIYGNCGGNWPVTSLESDFSDGVRLILLTGCLEVTLILVVIVVVIVVMVVVIRLSPPWKVIFLTGFDLSFSLGTSR